MHSPEGGGRHRLMVVALLATSCSAHEGGERLGRREGAVQIQPHLATLFSHHAVSCSGHDTLCGLQTVQVSTSCSHVDELRAGDEIRAERGEGKESRGL